MPHFGMVIRFAAPKTPCPEPWVELDEKIPLGLVTDIPFVGSV